VPEFRLLAGRDVCVEAKCHWRQSIPGGDATDNSANGAKIYNIENDLGGEACSYNKRVAGVAAAIDWPAE